MRKEQLNLSKAIEEYFATPDIHELEREERGGSATVAVSILAFIGECFMLYWGLNEQIAFTTALAMHAAIVLAICIYSLLLYRHHGENRFALLLLMAIIPTGPFGAAGVVLAVLVHHFGRRTMHTFQDLFESLFPALLKSRSQYIYDDILLGRDESSKFYSVIPFMDVLAFGNELQKRQALAKMAANFHPAFAPAFKKALGDPSNMIRVQAATAIAKIESQFLKRLIKLTAIKVRHPNDPFVVLALGEHYDNYAYTGLLDADREQTNRAKALELYHDYVRIKPEDQQIRARVGRILMRGGEYDKACEWFEQCLKEGNMSETLSDWYSEALYESGRFDDLRNYRAGLPPVSGRGTSFQPTLRETLMMWSGGGI